MEMERTNADKEIVSISSEEATVLKKMYLLHYYEVKIRALSKFIGSGNKVKVSLRFRGREHTLYGFIVINVDDNSLLKECSNDPTRIFTTYFKL